MSSFLDNESDPSVLDESQRNQEMNKTGQVKVALKLCDSYNSVDPDWAKCVKLSLNAQNKNGGKKRRVKKTNKKKVRKTRRSRKSRTKKRR